MILCTSGTTGDPREVELTHGNLVANLQGSVQKVDLGPDDVLGHILPPHHSFGMTVGKFLPLVAGATSIYTNKYRDVSDLIREKGITIFIAIPALYTTLAKKLEEGVNKQKKSSRIVALLDRFAPGYIGKKIRQKQGWTRVRFFLSGAAPMPRWVLEVLWRRGFKMYEGYGTTENSPVYGFNERLGTLGSVGKPINTLAVKIVDEENRTLAPHVRGEICLGGPCIAKGYYKNPKATEAVIDQDAQGTRWLHTGDLGYLDEGGNLYITGRKKYLIILPGGKNVNPERVETALSEAQFVREVLVVPTRREDDNGLMEELVRAIVQPAWESLESSHRPLAAPVARRAATRQESHLGEHPGLPAAEQAAFALREGGRPSTRNPLAASSSRPRRAKSSASTTSTWSTWKPSTRGSRSTSPRAAVPSRSANVTVPHRLATKLSLCHPRATCLRLHGPRGCHSPVRPAIVLLILHAPCGTL